MGSSESTRQAGLALHGARRCAPGHKRAAALQEVRLLALRHEHGARLDDAHVDEAAHRHAARHQRHLPADVPLAPRERAAAPTASACRHSQLCSAARSKRFTLGPESPRSQTHSAEQNQHKRYRTLQHARLTRPHCLQGKGGQMRTVMPRVREYPHTAGLLYEMFLALKLSCSSDDMAKPSMTPATMDRLRNCSERSLCAPAMDTSRSGAVFRLCGRTSGTAFHIRTRTTATSAALCSCSVRLPHAMRERAGGSRYSKRFVSSSKTSGVHSHWLLALLRIL